VASAATQQSLIQLDRVKQPVRLAKCRRVVGHIFLTARRLRLASRVVIPSRLVDVGAAKVGVDNLGASITDTISSAILVTY
jgi:hypothetical protein